MTGATELKAGPELDAPVGEKLMHLFLPWPWQFTDEDGVTHDRLPGFSTDNAAACSVIDAMAADGWISEVTTRPDRTTWARFHKANRASGHCISAPFAEAICLAALKAMETKS